MMRASTAHLLTIWDGVLPGAIVTLRRRSLTGGREEREKARTSSGPFLSESGRPVIRVQVDGETLSYPLERVSLGWDEPRPGLTIVPLAAALDPVPEDPWTAGERVVGVMFALLGIYVFGAVLQAVFG